MNAAYPDIDGKSCLNQRLADHSEKAACSRCQDICPAHAIELDEKCLPRLEKKICTDCAACVRICPSDAIARAGVDPADIIAQVCEHARQGKSRLRAACSAVSNACADLNAPCHALWDPMLLACMAAEGIRTLYLDGIDQCDSCRLRYGAKIMAQTEREYALLNKALGVHLEILRQKEAIPIKQQQSSVPEPARRAFFRNLIPSVAQGASMAAAQVGQAASQSIGRERQGKDVFNLPLRLQLFLRALPHLQANFTPVPSMPGLPLGAIQADDNCTACNQCVESCPTLALGIREFGANKVLEFRPRACIGCLHCIARCPEHALEPLPGISLPALLTERMRPLVMTPAGISDNARPAAESGLQKRG